MKSKLFKKRRPQNEDMSLQITAMADIFTVLLVFLLKTYATSAIEINPTAGMLLPKAFAAEAPVEALKLEVSEKSINIEGKTVAALEKYTFPASDLQANGASDTLSKALDHERQKGILIAKVNQDVKVDGRIVIIADQRVPYVTLKSVLASAALNGYTDFKLAVVNKSTGD